MARHWDPAILADGVPDPAPERARCICPYTLHGEIRRCRQRATQEDAICDECREWCIAMDSNGDIHLIAKLRPATTSSPS